MGLLADGGYDRPVTIRDINQQMLSKECQIFSGMVSLHRKWMTTYRRLGHSSRQNKLRLTICQWYSEKNRKVVDWSWIRVWMSGCLNYDSLNFSVHVA